MLPACPSPDTGLPPSFVFSAAARNLRPESEPPARWSTAMQATFVALPQGPSLRFGLYCPDPSSLIRPHPPRSQAHRDFTAQRLIRNVFAVRERLSDPRAVPGFHCTFLPDMPSPKTPESSTSSVPGSDVDIGLHHDLNSSALPSSCNPFHAGLSFRGFHGSRICYGLSVCLPPLHGSDRLPGRRGLLLPGFQRVSHPSRCWL